MSANQFSANFERSVMLQNAVNDFTLKILSITDKTELVWYVARKIVGDLGFDDCVIYLLDQKSETLRQVAAIGDKNPHGEVIDNEIEIILGEGITGFVAKSQSPIIIDDLSKDDRYIADKEPMLSEVCVPLIVDGQTIGVIDCEDARIAHFTIDHINILTRIAEITSIKIKSIEDMASIDQRADELEKKNQELKHEISEREKVEEKLRASYTRLADFSATTSDWYWEQDTNFRYTESHDYLAGNNFDFLGSIIGRTRWEAMNADIVSDMHWRKHYEDHIAHKAYRNFQYNIVDEDGNKFYLSVSGKPVFDSDGIFTGYRGTVSDITELVQVHNTNELFVQALDQTSDGLILWDSDEHLIICNDELKTMAGVLEPIMVPGLEYRTWLAKNIEHNLIPEAVGREDAWIEERLANFRSPTGPTEVLRDGRWHLYVFSKLQDGNTMQRIIDINVLKLERERFNLATKGAGVGIWEKTSEDGTSVWSDSYYEIFGLTPGEIEPSTDNFLSMVHSADRAAVEKTIGRSETAGEGRGFECRIRRKDGTTAWIYSHGKKINVGNTQHWFGIVVNIDKQKDAETAKNQFISTMNHELRTPLTAIIGLSELLIMGSFGELPPKALEMLRLSKKNSDRLLLLINDILEIDKLRAGQIEFNFEPMSADQLLMDAFALNEPYATDFEVKLANLQGAKPFSVMADPNRIQQVFSNLISNAVKFSPVGSTVELTMQQDGGFGVFSVKDYGSGIPEDFREKAFKRFTQNDSSDTRQIGGTGLGLSISRSIVEIHGGEIDFLSEQGSGTTFWFSVPISK